MINYVMAQADLLHTGHSANLFIFEHDFVHKSPALRMTITKADDEV